MGKGKNVPQNAKYGVPMATRVGADVASQILTAADRAGISVSKYLTILINRAVKHQDEVHDLEIKLKEQQDDCKQVAATFIKEIADSKPDKVQEYAKIYNQVKYEYDVSKSGIQFRK